MTGTYSIHHYPTHLIESCVLGNGRRVILRPALPQDEGLACAFVAGLSPDARRARFDAAAHGRRSPQAAPIACVDYQRHLVLVATTVQGEAGREREAIVADARYIVTDDGRVADFAIDVADDWRGLGLARRLITLLDVAAARCGVLSLRAEAGLDNLPLQGLLQGCGFQVVGTPFGEPADEGGRLNFERELEALPSLNADSLDGWEPQPSVWAAPGIHAAPRSIC